MPAPEPQRPDLPATGGSTTGRAPRTQDISAIPTFLREGSRHAARATDAQPRQPAAGHGTGAEVWPRPPTLPRPVTPRDPPARAEQPAIDPAALPMPSLSRRRVVTAAGVLLAGWLTLTFIRQVGEATDAATRAAELRAANAALTAEVERLQKDLGQVQDLRYIRIEGRAFGLGGRGEVPFALDAGASALPADAPGSAAVRLGADPQPASPLDAWLEVLFGSGR